MKIITFALLMLVATLAITANAAKKNKINKPYIAPMGSNTLNVHIVAHTHDDVGWLKTVDEYYYGANMSIQFAGVQYTIDSVVAGLLQNPNRKFIYVEIAFFMRWWREQTEETQKAVTQLVHSGQLEFINGGWCMNDEAATYYDDIIDQMTLGHQFLNEHFGVTPKIGWHIDPFGHSNTQATIFGNIGFDAFIIGRMDYQDIDTRLANKQMEFMWRGSKSTPEYQVFTSVLRAMYCTPWGFNFEGGDDPIQDDPNLFNYNIQERAEAFIAVAQEYSTHYRTNNVLIPFGCDFQYMNANMYFKNIDKLLEYINANPQYGINVLYSTPSIYIDAVNAAGLTWQVKTDDLFPYADNQYSYWTGYFVSRPALKGYVRQSNALLHVAEQLLVTSSDAIPSVQQSEYNNVGVLREALGVAQHHDAVAGTEQQHVAYDYAERLSIGQYSTYDALDSVVSQLLTQSSPATAPTPSILFCPLLNESACPVLDLLAYGTSVPIVLYNSLSWTRDEYVRFPIPISTVSVSTSSGTVPSQTTLELDGTTWVSFTAHVPPMGYNTYIVSPSSNTENNEISEAKKIAKSAQLYETVLSNPFISVRFDSVSGALLSITNVTSGAFINITQEYLFYSPSVGDNSSTQCDGAYIFRPIGADAHQFLTSNPQVSLVQGPQVQTLTRFWNENMIQVFRLYTNVDYLEVEETVGPIDIADGLGKEVITRFNTSLNTNNTWYSDSNGMEMVQRIIDYRFSWEYVNVQPVAGNYVPLNAITYIQDTEQQLQLTFLTDRSRSCASLGNGELEMMLHRRTLMDDGRGVGEPMNESTQIITTTKIVFHPIGNAAQQYYRPRALEHAHPLYPMFTTTQQSNNVWNSQYQGSYSPLNFDLPEGIRLHTLQWLDSSDPSVILRLQNIYAIDGQDTVNTQPVTVDLSNLFSFFTITSVTEMNLSATMKLSSVNRLVWKTATEVESTKTTGITDDFTITVSPMDVRTFIITLEIQICIKRGFESSENGCGFKIFKEC
ncbi:alpha-mannosidase [Heterostelium album PN500]|uniref:Alpha-mannosidase n=1 Tax=Heterostelium pallidum (strain ATCC 26659 / Pp 5 / PN500) TaxID=670386 RepID=D3B0W9_HETP5|nr:alpha-mannosidase [Heterostelium album PN500]EFA84943.1 alpha-mannosidase [Heterostelium album PN500]|eukprot:XP_020437053.1 alpha-mannosidase [Heterostelium album PN500]